MALWAVGPVNGLARAFIDATDPAHVMAQMEAGETVAPITEAQKKLGMQGKLKMLGDMKVAKAETEN